MDGAERLHRHHQTWWNPPPLVVSPPSKYDLFKCLKTAKLWLTDVDHFISCPYSHSVRCPDYLTVLLDIFLVALQSPLNADYSSLVFLLPNMMMVILNAPENLKCTAFLTKAPSFCRLLWFRFFLGFFLTRVQVSWTTNACNYKRVNLLKFVCIALFCF